MEVLQAKNLRKIYGSGNNAVHALDGVDLSVKKGEFVAIVGTSGSGKSTLLHMLGGLDRPTSGTVMVDGQDIFSLKEEALTIFRRRKIGFVFQAYNLVPVLNVYEILFYPLSWTVARSIRISYSRSYRPSDWRKSWMLCLISFPVVSSSVWQSLVHWRQLRLSSLLTNRQAIWIPRPAKMY